MFSAPHDLSALTNSYRHFLDDCPSPYHAAENVAQTLVDHGFRRQSAAEAWDASPGGHVMVRDGAVAAWFVPDSLGTDTPGAGPKAGFRIVGAHTDSPGLRLKPVPASGGPGGWGMIEVETYGGLLRNSWLDRELSVAGRIITADGGVHLVRTRPLARIPQLAIHLDRDVNNTGLVLDPQIHMHPVWTVGAGRSGAASASAGADAAGATESGAPRSFAEELMAIIRQDAGLEADAVIVGTDLILIPSQGTGLFGATGEFIAAGRQDNLSSVFAGLQALIDCAGAPREQAKLSDVLVFTCFDHEEIGSETATGAAGPLLEQVLRRTAFALGCDEDGAARMLAASTCISADAAHSIHPNYPERHDPVQYPVMAAGPVLKINANQRYATDGVGQAVWERALAAAEVSGQTFVSKNSVPCGSTIGPITATRLGIRTVDVGIPLLSMHSAREMSHIADLDGLSRALGAFWAGA
ncbi:MAG: M18 family aminopeptidase [Actinomycetaceae bacterium]|nr:M18 family aminopeptidase [Actinomycetaceae bacterium]